jgi:hypothetical protein
MKQVTLKIVINKPLSEGFSFSLNPENTPKWIDSIVEEKTNEWPVKLGTVYQNRGKAGPWNKYTVSAFEQDKTFEMTAADGNYHVRYVFTPLTAKSFELEYHEWVDSGELELPFTILALEKLKAALG